MRHVPRAAALAFAALACTASCAAQAEPATRSPAMDCRNWTRIGLHTWTQTGVIRQDGFAWSGNTLTNTDLTRMMDMLCTGGANDHLY